MLKRIQETLFMGRKRRQNGFNGLVAFLLAIMLVLAGAIVWLSVPMLAAQSFGQPMDYLTGSQKWSYSLQLLIAKDDLLSAPCSASDSGEFVIEPGSSVNLIANNLEKAGFIRNAVGFRSYLIYKGLDTQILAGTYQLNCSLPAVEIANKIRNIYQEKVVFVILPGWRAEEIAAALPTSGIEVSPADFMAVVKDPSGLDLPGYLPEGSAVEGLLFPGEYTVERTASAEELVQLLVNRFEQEISASLLKDAKDNGITPYQAIILASIVQRETFAAEERPLMASVFYNRLALGMRLETDPTVQYALGYDVSWGWWKSPLAGVDLQVDSAYNTYLISGLPPAPIANPDLDSIQAVVYPEKTDYLYFRAKCDGSGFHVFTTTFAEHQANGCN
jgi:UPF0755 protein